MSKNTSDTLKHQPHSLASTLRMLTAISPWQWQPWTAVSVSLLGLNDNNNLFKKLVKI